MLTHNYQPRISVAALVLVALLAACGGNSRLHTAMVGVRAASKAFVVFDKAHQAQIVAQATSEPDGIAALGAYRAKRTAVVDAFSYAFEAIAAVALLKEDETNALIAADAALKAWDSFRRAL